MLKLKLLGSPAIEAEGGPVTGRAAQGRRLALLAILALSRGRPVSRDKALALLWPESPTDRARRQLSDTLYILRSGLGDGLVRSAGDDLLLDPDRIDVDVAAFERLLGEGRLEAAVDLFAGPLLDGFHLSGGLEFERWLDGERAGLEERCAGALESLARDSEQRGDFGGAAGWWRRLAARDPYSGRVALLLMRSLEAAGDRAGALRHARAHSVLLRQEFDAEPDPDVLAFAERLRLEPPVRPTPEPVRPPADGSPRELAGPSSPVTLTRVPWRATGRLRVFAAASALVALTLLGYVVRRDTGVPSAPHSVAVLPFVNLGPEADDAYLSDGLSEEIIAALSRIEGVRVAARTSSFALRDRGLDVRAIADTLGVAAVLEGTVRRQGDRVRVTAQLVDAATGYHVWSDEHEREMADLATVQTDIAAAISGALELRLAGEDGAPRTEPRPGLEAYDPYLRGLYLRNTLSADGLRQAAEYFDRAIVLEPRFALAYAAKASVVAPLMYFGHTPLDQGVAEMRHLTGRALELDPSLGEAWASLGILKLFFEWDWDGAGTALRRATELSPNDPHAFHHLANYMSAMGRFRDAVEAREHSVRLDPLNARTRITLGNDYLRAGEMEKALAELRRAARMDPVNPLLLGLSPAPPVGPVAVHLAEGRLEDAVQELIRIATLRDALPEELQAIRNGWAASDIHAVWRAWLDMDSRQSGEQIDALRMASLLSLAGDTNQTFDWLERAHRERNPGLIYLLSAPAFDPVRAHPRFVRILQAMEFPADR